MRHPAGFGVCTAWRGSSAPWPGYARPAPGQPGPGQLNEGVSGGGNALVDLGGLPPPGSAGEPAELGGGPGPCASSSRHAVRRVRGQAGRARRHRRGADLGVELRSPSVQLRVTPLGEVELLSTHDQLSGGPSGQSYLGCRFRPTSPTPGRQRRRHHIGRRLAREGVLGRFAIDFVVVRDRRRLGQYAIELNLRKGGTTHPFLTLQFLTDGRYDAATALFVTPDGREKHLVATDHLEDPLLRGLRHDDLFDIVARHGLHFDQARQAGVVFHMISCLSEHGRVGLTAVGDTPAQADATYRRAERILLEEARSALTEPVLLDSP